MSESIEKLDVKDEDCEKMLGDSWKELVKHAKEESLTKEEVTKKSLNHLQIKWQF